jgi:hypothetical protein
LKATFEFIQLTTYLLKILFGQLIPVSLDRASDLLPFALGKIGAHRVSFSSLPHARTRELYPSTASAEVENCGDNEQNEANPK